METKICTKCEEEFPATTEYFHKDKRVRCGLRSWCKKCMRQRDRVWRQTNIDMVREKDRLRMQTVYKKEPEKIKAKVKKYNATPKGKLSRIRNNSAKTRNIPFNISLEFYEKEMWGKPCHYCGCEMKTTGLDRKDNNKGYTADNVVPCCKPCNERKNTKPYEEFLKATNKKTIDIERQDGYAYVNQ